LIIRTATLDDLAAIAAIQSAAPEAAQWDPEDYFQYHCRAAESDGRIAGFLATRQTAPDEREILNLAVDPAHRRQGIARALLQDALAGAHCDWYLEVRPSNTAAMGLYHSLGFQQITQRPGYYAAPSEPGIVMKLRS
jgi:ribosomal-protein-alanine N-acetyltransferase